MALYVQHHFAKKRGIGRNLLVAVRFVKVQEQVGMVAGDFNCAGWRRQSGSDTRSTGIIEEAFANTSLPIPPGPHRCGSQDACQASGLTFVSSQNRRGPRGSGRFVCMELSQSLSACRASGAKIRVATTKFGSTSSTSMLGWSIVYHGMTNLVDQIRG